MPVQPAFFLPGAPSEGSTGAPPAANFFMPSTGSTGQVWVTEGGTTTSTAFGIGTIHSCLTAVDLEDASRCDKECTGHIFLNPIVLRVANKIAAKISDLV